jgi:MFS family permease
LTDKEIYQPRQRAPRVFYGYIVVATTFIIMFVNWGLYITFGVFFDPMLNEFHWTRAMISGAYSLSSIVHGVLAIVMGGLNDRFGPRIVVTCGGILFGAGYMLMSQVNTPWQLYLFYGVITGAGMSGLWVPLLSSIARWFVERRSLMTGIAICGVTTGQLIGPPVASRLIVASDWRLSYIILGGVALLSIVIAAQFMRSNTPPIERPSISENKEKQPQSRHNTKALSLKEAVHTPQFWSVTIILFCFGYVAFSIIVHIVSHVTRLAIPAVSAANILAVNGGIGIIGNFVLGGIVGDRIGNRKVFIISFGMAMASLLWLAPAKDVWMFYLFAIVFGLALGGMGTSESPLVARLFGLSSHGLIYGVVGIGFTAGGALGPLVTGYICDITDSYQIAFLVCAGFGALGLILSALLRPTKKLGGKL